MKLILAEKPSMAKDIARSLGVVSEKKGYLQCRGYIVTWAVGHLVRLPEPGEIHPRYKRWQKDDLPILPEEFPLQVIDSATYQFEVIKRLQFSYFFSVGRVQSSTLAMVVYKDYLIECF